MALQVTVVLPNENVEPDDGVHDCDATPEPSVAENAHVTPLATLKPGVGLTFSGEATVYGGHDSVGGWVSETVIVNEHVLVLLA